jgi:hypothetical protein
VEDRLRHDGYHNPLGASKRIDVLAGGLVFFIARRGAPADTALRATLTSAFTGVVTMVAVLGTWSPEKPDSR